jgi:hypothetical protein
MKTKILKIAALIALFIMIISSANAQTCSISIIDPTPTSNYGGQIALYYLNGGIPTPVGNPISVTGLNPNSLNSRNLTWELPIDTEENIYILHALITEGGSSSNPQISSSIWFNTYYYFNNQITVTVRFN